MRKLDQIKSDFISSRITSLLRLSTVDERTFAGTAEGERLLHLTKKNSESYFIDVLNSLNDDENTLPAIDSSRLLHIKDSGSDWHDNHQSVVFLQFSNKNLVYKPRTINFEVFYYDQLNKFRQQLGYRPAPNLFLLDRENYGWMEFLNPSSLTQDAQLWQDLGLQLALLTAMRSSDHHTDNLIAANGFVYPIDLECSFVPKLTVGTQKEFTPRSVGLLQNFEPLRTTDEKILWTSYEEAVELINTKSFQKELNSIQSTATRLVFRNTEFYTDLLAASLQLDVLINRSLREEFIEQVLSSTGKEFPEIVAVEKSCLIDGIIPKFMWDGSGLFCCSRFVDVSKSPVIFETFTS